jgi:Zn-dependent protease
VILGIPVRVGWSWLVIAPLVAGTFLGRAVAGGEGWPSAALVGMIGTVLFVAGVLAHELSHAVVARRRGLTVHRVTLFVFGGYTEMEPGDRRHEPVVALAGPVASLVTAGVLWGGAAALGGRWAAAADAFGLLAVVNLAVAVFNLLPGLPLDGGRVLRSVLARRLGDPEKATLLAARAGQVLAALLALGGSAAALLAEAPVMLWNVLVGWFLYRVATESQPGGRAGALAVVPGRALPAGAGAEAVAAARAAGSPVPVVEEGRVIGVIPVDGPPGSAVAAMVPLRRRDLVGPGVWVATRARRPRIVVEDGRMVGVIPPGGGGESR